MRKAAEKSLRVAVASVTRERQRSRLAMADTDEDEKAWTLQKAFSAVDEKVKSWRLGEYQHHVRHLKDNNSRGTSNFVVVFSIPLPAKPVPEFVAQATFTVVPPREYGESPKVTYTLETQRQRLPGTLPIRRVWLDAALRRKQRVAQVSADFATTGRLPKPEVFLPGQYMAAQTLAEAAFDGLDENEDRLADAMQTLGEAQVPTLPSCLLASFAFSQIAAVS